MIEEYVTFTQAKELNELGFPQNSSCIVEYYEETINDWKSPDDTIYYAKPTLSLAQKWLREEKDISLEMSMFRKELAVCNLFIIDDEGIKWIKDAGTYEGKYAYEQALSAGIDASIKILKKLKNAN